MSLPLSARHRRGAGASSFVIAAVVVALVVTGAIPHARAHEVADRPRDAEVAARPERDHLDARPRLLGMTAGRAGDDGSLQTAFRLLLCLEAGRAIRSGAFDRHLLDWILATAHTCGDNQLLVDAFGF